jgi:signal transduction histidine kinase
MRRQLTLLVAATTTLVLLAFLLPLAALVRTSARDDAVTSAAAETQALVPVVGQAEPAEIEQVVAQVARETGHQVTVFLGSGQQLGDAAEPDARVAAATRGAASSGFAGGGYVVVQPVLGRPDGPAVIRVLVPPEDLRQGVLGAWLVLGGLGGALLVLALVVADRLARRLTRPISDLATTAQELESGDITARVEPSGPAELREVGTALNQLAGRIGELLVAEREAVADLSHRLRTPVAVLRLDAEGLADPQERGRLSDDVDELERQVDDLIREARRPVREGLAAQCDAIEVARDRVAFWAALAEEQDRVVELELPEAAVLVRASAADLGAALDALLGNVFAHTPEGVGFAVRASRRPEGGCVVVVEDAGQGMPSDGSAARGVSGAGSTGLGLDIARRTAEASGGGLSVAASGLGGAQVTVLLGAPAPGPRPGQ